MKKVALLMAVLMLVFSCAGALASQAPAPNPVVEVEQGKLMGFMNGNTYTFLGVPYATAARFEMPQKPAAWEGVRKALTYGEICPIPEQTAVGYDEVAWPHRYWPQNENCQFVNIWTQSVDTTAKKPVMVFFHGGGHTNGSSIEAVAYEGKNLSEFGDVVVVTLNHRLNVLGYLDLSAYGGEYSANLGTMDLVAALQWIHDNIAKFGGDADNVTIFGQSGGGGKVDSMMHAPSAQGLFQRGIIESSGGAGLTSRPQADSQKLAELTLAELGLDASTVDQIKTVPYRTLLDAANKAIAKAKELNSKGNYGWGPVADEKTLTMDYCEWTKDMPLMVGCVFSESNNNTLKVGDGRKNEWTAEEVKANLEQRFGTDADAVLAAFKKLFPNKIDADAFFYANGYSRVISTRDAWVASGHNAPYTYTFAYEAPVNGGISAFHCSELIYVFHNVDLPLLTLATGGNEDAHRIQDQVAQAWINYARSGDPSQDGLEWPNCTAESNMSMIFDVQSGAVTFDAAGLLGLMGTK